jgi:hypothetical protein
MNEIQTDAEKAAAYAKSVAGDAVKAASTLETDVQKVKTVVSNTDNKLAAWLKANPKKAATALLVVAVLVVLKLVFKII